MRTVLFLQNLFIALAVVGSSRVIDYPQYGRGQPAAMQRLPGVDRSFASMSISLKAANDATILFKTETGEISDPAGKERKIPHLVLNRNGVPTPGYERTLQISLENLYVPASGLYVGVKVETQHKDPDADRGSAKHIAVWEETRFVPYNPDSQEPRSLDFAMVFQRATERQGTSVRTPTDYYRYELTLFDPQGNTLRTIEQKYAFLLENQWRVPLPQVLEADTGAAPQELVVYFCDMVPFQSDNRDPESRIPRQDVERYIQTELVPAMVKAFEMQSTLWEMPWYQEWSNSRKDEGPKTLSVALGGSGTWFHGTAPSLGHAMISIRVDGSFGEYESITDGIMSVFHHELFHNQQRNISLHYGARGNIAGQERVWEFFSEGTAVLASLVGQPAVQWEVSGMPRSYLKRANAFIGLNGAAGGGLNKSFTKVPYHTAIYWRFLYEQCGGIRNGVEDPATGMRVIRHALEILYSGEVADINSSTAAIEAFPRIIDRALQATPTCVLKSFDETLIHFTRAIYMLRRAEGRCQAGSTAACGFYDPGRLYSTPNAERYSLMAEARTQIDGSIPSSFGVDLVEVSLDPALDGRRIQVVFNNISDPDHEFNVEVWANRSPAQEDPLQGSSEYRDGPVFSEKTSRGKLILKIDRLDWETALAIDLVITRLDRFENTLNPGEYTIQVTVD